jgi:hypothetical protein
VEINNRLASRIGLDMTVTPWKREYVSRGRRRGARSLHRDKGSQVVGSEVQRPELPVPKFCGAAVAGQPWYQVSLASLTAPM